MTIYGYARCSTDESKQDVKRQVNELLSKYDIAKDNMFFEYESGAKDDRKQFNKMFLNDYIYKINKSNFNYYRDNSIHIIKNDKYNKLVVNSACLILKSNDIYSVFLNDLNECMDNIFICDFKNKDYFWLESLNLDRQMEGSLV